MDPLFDLLIKRFKDQMIWYTVAIYNGSENPDVLHGPFTYADALRRKDDIVSGNYGDYKKAKVVVDLTEMN